MSYYPPPEGSGYPNSQSGYPNSQSGYPSSQSGYPAQGPQQTFNHESGYGQPYGGQPGYPQGPEGYPSAYNAPQPGGYPQADPYSHGAPGPYPGGFPDGQSVPKEELPPGYNPTTGRAFEPNELPYGASPAPEGFEGAICLIAALDPCLLPFNSGRVGQPDVMRGMLLYRSVAAHLKVRLT